MKKAARSKSNRRPLETDWIFWTFRNSGQNSGQKSTAKIDCTAVSEKMIHIGRKCTVSVEKSPEILRFQDFLVEISGIEPLTS